MTEKIPGEADGLYASAEKDNTTKIENFKPGLDHLATFLASSGLELDDVPDWRYVTNADLNAALGRSGPARVSGAAIEIPYFGIDGQPVLDRKQPFRRFRLLSPVAGGPKYLSRGGSDTHIYVPGKLKAMCSPSSELPEDESSDRVLVICEGEKKAERLIKLGIPAAAVAGVTVWADSEARGSEKAKSESRGEKAPRLTRNSPVARDIVDLIRDLSITKIVVVFDSDGLPIDDRAAGISGKFKKLSDGQVCLNPDVFLSGKIFAAALMRSCPGVAVSLAFTPHSIADDGTLGRQGIDDWSLIVDASEIQDFVNDAAARARSMTPGEVQAEIERIEQERRREEIRRTKGFVPLGYSSSADSTIYHVWSRHLEVVKSFTDTSLTRKTAFYGAFGAEYCDEILGKPIVIQKADEKKGIPEVVKSVFDLDIGQRAVTQSCQAAGRWSPGASVRGAGVWSDEQTGGLIVNCADGLILVRSDGGTESIDRVRGRWIYESTDRGGWADDAATPDEIRSIIGVVEDGWHWSRESDGLLLAGWILAQAYVGALKARPGGMLNGESGCGKSYLEEYLKKLIGPWAIRIEETRGTSLAGISQLIKRDALTVFFDEIEPKTGSSPDEAARVNRTIDAIRQMLRAAYSRSDDEGSYGSVKGTAHQEAVAREVRVCGLMASIAEHELEQADRNRNLRLRLRRIEVGADGKPIRRPPAMPEPGVGLRAFRLMWSRWAAFQATLDRVEQLIDHREPRMRLTLATPLAAIAVALGRHEDAGWVETLVAQINAEHGGAAAIDEAPRDQDRALQRLLAAMIDVGGARKSVGDAVSTALAAGLGQRGRGAGGLDGDALRLHGLTARRSRDGVVSLFVAAGHHGVEALGRQIGVASLAALLGAVEGAEMAKREERVRLGPGGKWSGVWVPTEIATIAAVDDADEPDTEQPAEEATPY